MAILGDAAIPRGAHVQKKKCEPCGRPLTPTGRQAEPRAVYSITPAWGARPRVATALQALGSGDDVKAEADTPSRDAVSCAVCRSTISGACLGIEPEALPVVQEALCPRCAAPHGLLQWKSRRARPLLSSPESLGGRFLAASAAGSAVDAGPKSGKPNADADMIGLLFPPHARGYDSNTNFERGVASVSAGERAPQNSVASRRDRAVRGYRSH